MYLLIDNYDSFTYNLYHYFLELGAKIEIYRNDKITTQDILKKKYNRDKSKFQLDLDLTIYRFDDGSTNTFQDKIEVDVDKFSNDLLLEAKLKVENFVKNQWKVQNVLSTIKNSIKLTVNYNNLKEWVDIRSLINNVSIIDKYKIVNISKNFAVISISFSGNYNQLRIALKQSDLEFDIHNRKVNLLK